LGDKENWGTRILAGFPGKASLSNINGKFSQDPQNYMAEKICIYKNNNIRTTLCVSFTPKNGKTL